MTSSIKSFSVNFKLLFKKYLCAIMCDKYQIFNFEISTLQLETFLFKPYFRKLPFAQRKENYTYLLFCMNKAIQNENLEI